ncbi:endonuclease/exonuclease/phosphatase family protein [Candidatus Woesearchaeota archaeon]|nr:endonuclease/exonuclease/phosphatase family protein [Candidatus Woesearchaeota archaeon]
MRKGVILFLLSLLFTFSVNAIIYIPGLSSPDDIKVMTYNIRYACGHDEKCGDYTQILAHLKAVVEQQQPDILVIQEGNNKGREGANGFRDPFTFLKEQFIDTYDSSGFKVGIFVRKSKGTLDSAKINTYSSDNKGRAYLRAEVMVSGQKVVVYNTHLFPGPLSSAAQKLSLHQCVDPKKVKASVEANKNAQDFSLTESEAKELAGIVAKEVLPVIVMGDFNAELNRLSSLKSVLSVIELPNGHTKSFPVKPYCAETDQYGYQDWKQDLDHIFYKGFQASQGTVVVGETTGVASDHYPVVATLRLTSTYSSIVNCGYSKIAVMGASNTVESGGSGSYASYIRSSCSSSTTSVFPKDPTVVQSKGYSIQVQEKELLDSVLSGKPDLLIIDPSGNTCSAAKDATSNKIAAEEGIASVNSVISKALAAGVKKFVVLTIPPRGNVAYNDCITQFNVLLKSSGSPLKVVDIYPTLLDPTKTNSCRSEYCSADGLHWTDAGDRAVAAQILKEVFGVQLVVKSSSGTAGGGTSGVGIQVGTTAATQQISQKCQIEQRCKDIDSAWTVFGGLLGIHAGEVWVPPKNTWMTFANAYNAKQVIQSQPTTVSSSAGNSASGVIQCATADKSMTPEQKALLDTIAYAEGTTLCGFAKKASSYNIMLGCRVINSLSAHPRKTGEMPVGGFPFGNGGETSTAAGRYQFLYCAGNACDNFFPNGFGFEEQDKEAWSRVEQKRGVSLGQVQAAGSEVSKWDPLWDALAREWSSIRYNPKGTSYYSQGSGFSHETLTKAYTLCLNYYKAGASGANAFSVNNGKALSSSSSAALQSTPTTSSGSRILHIGDSHIKINYGSALHSLLMSTGASVQTYGIGCTTPAQWVDGPAYIPVGCAKGTTLDFIDETGKMSQSKTGQDKPRLSELKNSFNPNMVIISLGTNIESYVGNDDAYNARIKAAADLAKQAVNGGSKCYWVGPPKRKSEADAPKVAAIVAGLKTVVEPHCTFIDSSLFTDASKATDDPHYNAQGGKDWAQNVFNQISS